MQGLRILFCTVLELGCFRSLIVGPSLSSSSFLFSSFSFVGEGREGREGGRDEGREGVREGGKEY